MWTGCEEAVSSVDRGDKRTLDVWKTVEERKESAVLFGLDGPGDGNRKEARETEREVCECQSGWRGGKQYRARGY